MSFPKYEAYKDSGVEWLGEVPEHWALVPLKWLCELVTTKAIDTSWQIGLENVESWSGRFIETESEFAGSGLAFIPNDILFGKLRPYLAKAYLADNSGDAVGDFFVLRPRTILANYLHKYILSTSVINTLNASTIGAKMPRVSWEDMGGLSVAVPTVEEQTQIARFLDHETARIDALIAEQHRLIELLKEKRQAVISHAVTKGLDPTAPLKDSGVEWLGEVPAHWEIGKFKWFLRTASGGTPPSSDRSTYYDGDIPWLRSLDLNDDLVTDFEVSVTRRAIDETSCKMVPKHSVLIAMYGGDGTIGKNGLLMFDSAINQALCAFLPSPNFESKYLHRYIQFYRPYWMINAESSRKDPNIGQDRIGDHYIPIPSIREQRRIADFLEEELSKLNNLSIEANLLVSHLQERRSALISAAVTGKIDVRGWQAPTSAAPTLEPAHG